VEAGVMMSMGRLSMVGMGYAHGEYGVERAYKISSRAAELLQLALVRSMARA
jgi:hypothetical protein